ncbi:MAG TPA: copper homeostasis protein CutC [Gemmatimonadaceae bacterium]|nr:copper homeostasis protein CutC [Gemmatimonadaceae bacterium]
MTGNTEKVLVEACVDSVASALAAERGGARRLELCDNLFDGGTTPSAGMMSAVKAAVHIPVFVIVRPRGGGFVYTYDEMSVMRLDIEAARMLGADGVVVGVLTRDARVDAAQLRTLVETAGDLPVTFHRAFDLTQDRDQALEILMQTGVTRVLTSGGAPSALEGVAAIHALVRRAAGQMEIMAGGGVREETVQEIVHRAGVREVHVRGTRPAGTAMAGGQANIRLRKALPEDEGTWEETDERRIREFVRLANG